MESKSAVSSMYFIVDGSGNYYRVNNSNQLVAVESREYAGVFSFAEANQKIGGGKKSHFYSTIPVEEKEETKEPTVAAQTGQKTEPVTKAVPEEPVPYSYDMQNINWEEYLNQFCYLASTAKDYQEELKQALSDLDMQICDIMHCIELYDLDESDSVRMVELLKECREQRRDVKDEMVRVECFQKSIGTSANVAKVKDNMVQIKKLATRSYHPRKLPALFNHCMEETVRANKLMKAMSDTTCMEDVDYVREQQTEEMIYDTQVETEEEVMKYTKQTTIFDDQDTNWLAFARQQEAFYANAEQYLVNLQIRQDELEEELEQVLEEIENASYNVTQGYNVYKRLKELRNEKKKVQKEQEALYILTYGINCAQMSGNMAACVEELEALYGVPASTLPRQEEQPEEETAESVLHEVMMAG